MGAISEAWSAARAAVPEHVTLVAVSKTKPVKAVVEAYQAGARLFGENRVQELVSKHEALTAHDAPDPTGFAELRWHQIGTLQRNKVKYMLRSWTSSMLWTNRAPGRNRQAGGRQRLVH